MDSKLLCKIVQGIERVTEVKPFLILTVTALDLAIVARRIWTDQLMPDTKLGRRLFKQSRQVTLTVREPIGKLKAVVRLDALHFYTSALIPFCQLPQEVRGGISGLLRVGGEETQACELVDGGVLEQAKLRIRNALTRHDFHVDLNALSGMCHLLVRLRFVRLFRLFSRKQAHFAHDTEQAFRTACIAALSQAVPKFDHAQGRVPAAHVSDELQLGLRVLIRMAVGAFGLTGQGRHTSVPALLPEVDVRPALVVLPTGAADAVFLCVLH